MNDLAARKANRDVVRGDAMPSMILWLVSPNDFLPFAFLGQMVFHWATQMRFQTISNRRRCRTTDTEHRLAGLELFVVTPSFGGGLLVLSSEMNSPWPFVVLREAN